MQKSKCLRDLKFSISPSDIYGVAQDRKEMATATYDSVGKSFNDNGSLPEDGLRLLIEEAKKAAKISREIASSKVADLSILREAQKELAIK
jgi:hypothetical protein